MFSHYGVPLNLLENTTDPIGSAWTISAVYEHLLNSEFLLDSPAGKT